MKLEQRKLPLGLTHGRIPLVDPKIHRDIQCRTLISEMMPRVVKVVHPDGWTWTASPGGHSPLRWACYPQRQKKTKEALRTQAALLAVTQACS